MKDTHFLYGIATFTLVGIFTGFIGYATDMLPTHTPRQQGPVETTTTVVNKKSCSCCEDREKWRKRFQKIIQQARARGQTEQQVVNANSP